MRERPGADSLPCALLMRALPGGLTPGWSQPDRPARRPETSLHATTVALQPHIGSLNPEDLPNRPGFGLESRAQHQAGVAQLVEQRIRNAKVGSSTLFTGTKFQKATLAVAFCFSGAVSALLASCCRSFRWATAPEQQGVGALPPLPTLKPSATPTCAGASPLIGTNLGPDPALRWKSHGNGTSPRHTPPTY